LFQEIDDTIRVTTFKAGSGNVPSGEPSSPPIDDSENAIQDHLEANLRAKISDLTSGTGMSRASVNRAISKLKIIGMLYRTGSRTTGEWAVKRN